MDPLTLDAAGNIYGESSGGNSSCGCGLVFELSPNKSGKYTGKIVHTFNGGVRGSDPSGGLVLDEAGNLYGTTSFGGQASCLPANGGCGVAFRLSPTQNGGWHESVVKTFIGGRFGAIPYGGLIFDRAGNLYGGTVTGGTGTGCFQGCGIIYELSPNGSGVRETELYSFPSGYRPDGAHPSHLAFDSKGNLYGTTQFGGDNACATNENCGSVFELSPNGSGGWNGTTIYSFDKDGANAYFPFSNIAFDAKGNLYGVTESGGDCPLCGVVYEIAR